MEGRNVILKDDNEWCEGTILLLNKWERVCKYRKKAHATSARSYGWKNKFLSIPTILISTILGSLSFIHPSFMGNTSSGSRMLSARNLQTISPTPECGWGTMENEDDIITTYPYCDNSIINYNDEYYQSSLSEVQILMCDQNVNWVDGYSFTLYDVPMEQFTQDLVERWCIEKDQGNGIFYQRYADTGETKCGSYDEYMEGSAPIKHTQHLFGGVCLRPSLIEQHSVIYIKRCESTSLEEITNGDCTEVCGGAEGVCPDIGIGPESLAFWDCECCYSYWGGCSFDVCWDWCYPNCDNIQNPPPSPFPIVSTTTPTYTPTNIPVPFPTRIPTSHPTLMPTYTPSKQPTLRATTTSSPTTSTASSSTHYVSYIIGVFNMVIAILSALHTFLKYDTLEDRHNQYSRHFGNLKVDLETLLAKPIAQRGSAGTMIERYKTKYTVLINNAPELAESLEQSCCGVEDSMTIEMT